MTSATRDGATEVVIIQPSQGWLGINVADLWARRELLYFLAWREIKVRYKQTLLGVSWAILQPLFTMIIFSLFFGRLAKTPSDGIPYPLFVLTALVPWMLFANGLTLSSNSLVNNSQLITKIYFPRLLVPTAAVLSGVVDFLLTFVLLLLMILKYGRSISIGVLLLPLFIVLTVIASLGVGLWLSALNVEYRDIRHVVPFLVQMWMFATPVAYPSSLLHAEWQRVVYSLNPMVGVVEGFRWAVLGARQRPDMALAMSLGMSLVTLVTGALFFRRTERRFADLI